MIFSCVIFFFLEWTACSAFQLRMSYCEKSVVHQSCVVHLISSVLFRCRCALVRSRRPDVALSGRVITSDLTMVACDGLVS